MLSGRGFAMVSVALAVGAAAACGSSVTDGDGGSGTGTGTGTATTTGSGGTGTGTTTGSGLGGSGGSVAGECIDSTDCGGEPCLELTAGGYRTCTDSPPEATACDPQHVIEDECCTSDDCTGGACYLFTDLPYCGGPQPADYNTCVTDQCSDDSQCAGSGAVPSVCAPRGTFGNPMRVCVVAFCTTNADCNEGPGGLCAAIDNTCCPGPQGLGCVYPGGCKTDSECSPNDHCELDYESGEGICSSGPMPCPA